MKDTDTYQKLNKDFSNLISNYIKDFVNILQDNESDILGLEEKYYKTHGKSNNHLWKYANVSVKTELKVNNNGFIFEVQ